MATQAEIARPISPSRATSLRTVAAGDGRNARAVVTDMDPQATTPTARYTKAFEPVTARTTSRSSVVEKSSEIAGTVVFFDADFVMVKAEMPSGSMDFKIPRVLCPDEVIYENTPVTLRVGLRSGFSGLEIVKREKRPIPQGLASQIDELADWADSL